MNREKWYKDEENLLEACAVRGLKAPEIYAMYCPLGTVNHTFASRTRSAIKHKLQRQVMPKSTLSVLGWIKVQETHLPYKVQALYMRQRTGYGLSYRNPTEAPVTIGPVRLAGL